MKYWKGIVSIKVSDTPFFKTTPSIFSTHRFSWDKSEPPPHPFTGKFKKRNLLYNSDGWFNYVGKLTYFSLAALFSYT